MSDIKYALYTSSKGFKVVGGTAAQFLKGDGSVDTTSYIPTGTDINMADKNINFTTGSISRFENNSRVFNKVFQRLYGGVQTGILSFKFPQATTSATMFDVTIKISGWNSRIVGTIRVTFYKFSATVLNSNHKAIIECSDNFPTTVINVGLDSSGYVCINIGDSNTAWTSYLNVEVERVVAFHNGANFDWSKGWSQSIETDVSTYTQLLPIATEVVATRTWVDQNNIGSIPKSASLLSTDDLNTFLTPGFYYQHSSTNATPARNYPIALAGYLNVYRASTTRLVQEYTEHLYGRTWKRVYDGTSWTSWKKVWTEIDFSQTNIDTWNAATVEAGNNLKILGNGVSKHNFSNIDVFTMRNTAMWATGGANRPVNTNSAILNVTPYNSGGTYGFSLAGRTNRLFFVTEENTAFGSWLELYHTGNFSPSNYYTKNESLNQFVGKTGVETISDTKTFTHSPVIPDGTLGTHAVNKNQITLSTNQESEGGQQLNISGNNTVTLTNFFVTSQDGTRNADDIAPNSTPRRARFDFVKSNTAGLGGSGNYAGIMTYSPWDGTSASTGDSSYQLAFANQSGTNGSGIPMLKIRKGIDGSWTTKWYKFWTEADFSSSNIQQWNYAYQYGLKLNEEFTVNQNTGLVLADDYFGGESGIIDHQRGRSLVTKIKEYYFYGSEYGNFDGLNFNSENTHFGMGIEANDSDKLNVEGSVKASKNFKSEGEKPDTIFIPNGNLASLRDEIINDESEYAIRLNPHEYLMDSFSSLEVDDRNRLIHVIGEYSKMVVNFRRIYPKQQIVVYNFDKSGATMEVKIQGKTVYNIEPRGFVRFYVTNSLRVIAERQLPCDMIW
ncbi:pyocin knob domain-containing protein [Chryseobacterium taeanense]|uniref:pyocin knob domain-containing protein n=1 Tax=Chryseobacterium taeanense TaxID=311334 RepID=UPI0035B3CC57